VVLTRAVLHREAHGDSLLIPWLSAFRCVWFVRLCLRFRTEHMLHLGEVQQFAIWRGVDEEGCFNQTVSPRLQPTGDDAGHPILMGPGCDRSVGMQDEQPATQLMREHHLVEHRHRNARVMAKPAHPSIARVERALGMSCGRQRQIGAIVVSNTLAQCSVAGGCPELFNPRVFIGRDSLVRELTADPMRLFRENDSASEAGNRERRCTRAEPAADNGYVSPKYLHVLLYKARTSRLLIFSLA
jgi:hypothetical protein